MATVTTIAAVGGLAMQGVSAGMSFAQANKQRNAQEQAERDAAHQETRARGSRP